MWLICRSRKVFEACQVRLVFELLLVVFLTYMCERPMYADDDTNDDTNDDSHSSHKNDHVKTKR